MSNITTHRGQTFSGLIVTQTDKSLTLQTQTDLKTMAAEDIDEINHTTLSPMPDGLLNNLSADDIRDLFSYLMHPHQVEVSK